MKFSIADVVSNFKVFIVNCPIFRFVVLSEALSQSTALSSYFGEPFRSNSLVAVL